MALNGKYPVLLVSTDSGASGMTDAEIKQFKALSLAGGNIKEGSVDWLKFQELKAKYTAMDITASDLLNTAFPIIFDGTVVKAVAKSYATSMSKRIDNVGGKLLMKSATNIINVQITYQAKKTFGIDSVIIDSLIALADYFYAQPEAQPMCAFIGGSIAVRSGYLLGVSHGETEDTEEGTITLTIQKNPELNEIGGRGTSDKTPAPIIDEPLRPQANALQLMAVADVVPNVAAEALPKVDDYLWCSLDVYNDVTGSIYPEQYSQYTINRELVRFDHIPDYAVAAFGYQVAVSHLDYCVPLMDDGSLSASADGAVAAMLYNDLIYVGYKKKTPQVYTAGTSAIGQAFEQVHVPVLPPRAFKDCITPYVGMTRDVARLESYMTTQLGSLYYAPDIGFDFNYWLKSDVEFQNQALAAWLTSEALLRAGIVTESLSVKTKDFILHIDYVIAGQTIADGSGSSVWDMGEVMNAS